MADGQEDDLAIMNLERLDRVQSCLGDASGLADEFVDRRHDFPDRVLDWLGKLESAAKDAGLPVVPRLASLRVELEASKRGLSAPSTNVGRLPPRKARNAAAQMALRSAVEAISDVLAPFEVRRARAEDLALYLVSHSFGKLMWPGQSQAEGAPRDMQSMWQAMLADDALGPSVREISAMLGVAQGMMLVARTMNDFATTGAS